MGAGAKGPAGIDRQVEHPRASRRLLPRWAQVEPPPDQHRHVEALPALLPVLGHLRGGHADSDTAHMCLAHVQLRQLAGRAVDGQLHHAVAVHLLDARGRELQQGRQDQLGSLGGRADCQADQDEAGAATVIPSASTAARRSPS